MHDFKKRPDFYEKQSKYQDVPYYVTALILTYSGCWVMFYALEVYSIINHFIGE